MAASASADGILRDDQDQWIDLCTDIGNAAGEHLSGVIELEQPAAGSMFKLISFRLEHLSGTPTLFRDWGEGFYQADGNALDGLQFRWSTGGNFQAIGEVFLEGLRTA